MWRCAGIVGRQTNVKEEQTALVGCTRGASDHDGEEVHPVLEALGDYAPRQAGGKEFLLLKKTVSQEEKKGKVRIITLTSFRRAVMKAFFGLITEFEANACDAGTDSSTLKTPARGELRLALHA